MPFVYGGSGNVEFGRNGQAQYHCNSSPRSSSMLVVLMRHFVGVVTILASSTWSQASANDDSNCGLLEVVLESQKYLYAVTLQKRRNDEWGAWLRMLTGQSDLKEFSFSVGPINGRLEFLRERAEGTCSRYAVLNALKDTPFLTKLSDVPGRGIWARWDNEPVAVSFHWDEKSRKLENVWAHSTEKGGN